MIKITLDKNLDKETFLNFFELKAGGVDFGEKIIKSHPTVSKDNYQEYINDYYDKNKEELTKSLLEINDLAQQRQVDFFNAVKDIFKQDFSSKEYCGTLSIFDCNPRYLDKNVFQVYYKRSNQDKLRVIFHEVIHFIFFDYCRANLGGIVNGMDQNQGKYWDLSEIFNVIILNQLAFQKIIKKQEKIFYPKHKEIYSIIEKKWQESDGNMEKFIKESLVALS
ncbi:TPA: hypothetical protein DEW47_00635 [Patescibacteria group bacterium]|nr:MAG: hypothetical protein UT71_C0017G0023 [Parcubacteria group bacterium GW2011_GWF2_40_10]KKR47515.1 MAG: hypothetical protein UT83_C0008G0023 [Parcubacteria group bacterium GW2011_GWA2_40_143]KKR59934.1 MAG: hypothetical protein UT97_C0008G0024 [Parcubacteria group bacterium GW2011_GWC2_40_31]KKR74107.1 MAG: hypothetical protein UU18_C0034G0003 [Parcubacteria group bacterium GW2011_GWB2_40_8]KKR75304.1 MAG: hypothetical protein UU20_C0057G0002 [Parcubacteria group bacterium GW2011_GWE2_40_